MALEINATAATPLQVTGWIWLLSGFLCLETLMWEVMYAVMFYYHLCFIITD